MSEQIIYIHYGNDYYNLWGSGQITNKRNWTKPNGGLWASREDDPNGWKAWRREERFHNRKMKKYFRFMHLCDGPAGPDGDPVLGNINDELMLKTARETRLYPGDGCMDIRGMVDALGSLPLSIELPNLKEIGIRGREGHARECLRKAKELLG